MSEEAKEKYDNWLDAFSRQHKMSKEEAGKTALARLIMQTYEEEFDSKAFAGAAK